MYHPDTAPACLQKAPSANSALGLTILSQPNQRLLFRLFGDMQPSLFWKFATYQAHYQKNTAVDSFEIFIRKAVFILFILKGSDPKYLFSMDKRDLDRVDDDEWIRFLEGDNPGYPEGSLRGHLEFVRGKIDAMRTEPTTPETRLADWPLRFNPVRVHELVRLMWGGNIPGRIWTLHTRLRYFEPVNNRAGLPCDVATSVTGMKGASTTAQLVNINQVESRTVVVQTGVYGEHECVSVKIDGEEYPVNSHHFTVVLDPGAGAEIEILVDRYANQPTLNFPW